MKNAAVFTRDDQIRARSGRYRPVLPWPADAPLSELAKAQDALGLMLEGLTLHYPAAIAQQSRSRWRLKQSKSWKQPKRLGRNKEPNMKIKTVTLKDCDAERLKMLRDEIGKVRCWLTGFHEGRRAPGDLRHGIPGEDALRQIQVIIDQSI